MRYLRVFSHRLIAPLLLPVAAVAGAEPALQEIIVTGARTAQSAHESPLPIGVIDRAEIERRQARGVEDLLRGMPGVTTSGGPRPEAVNPNVRGLGDGRVVVRLDGARQNLNISHRGQTFLDPMLIERVEVLRGPASTLYGSGAIGGVVNFHTLDADGFLGKGDDFGGVVRAGFQNNGRQRLGGLTLAGRHEAFGLVGSVSHRRADDYEDGRGDDIPYSDVDAWSGLLKGTWRPSPEQRITLGYLGFHDDSRSLVTADRPSGVVIDRDTRQHTGTLRYEWRPADNPLWDLDISFYATDVVLDERERFAPDTQKNELSSVGLDAFNRSELSIAGLAHQLVYGVEYYRDRQKGSENGQPRPGFASSRQGTLGLFLQDRIALGERLSLTVGGRYDRIEQRADQSGLENSRYSEWSLQASAGYELATGLNLYGGYAEAFRAPALRELFVGGQHFPGNQYVPNPELKPESARNIELGLSYQRDAWLTGRDRLYLRLGVFRNDIEDFIEQVVRGAPVNTTRFENVDDARIEGLEMELRYDTELWRVLLSAARLRGDDRGDDLPLESIPADEVMLEVTRRWPAYAIETGLRGTLTRPQRRVPPGPHSAPSTDGHSVVDLFLLWRPDEAWSIDLAVDNLTDQTYRRHLTTINERGRTVKLGAAYRF